MRFIQWFGLLFDVAQDTPNDIRIFDAGDDLERAVSAKRSVDTGGLET